LTRSPSAPQQSIDYLVVGHCSRDLSEFGEQLGGTAAFAGLAAHVLGRKVGILTSCANTLNLDPLEGLAITRIPSERTTSFENTQTEIGRIQRIHAVADGISVEDIPHAWVQAEIVHLGPIAQEVEFSFAQAYSGSYLGLTPQGWLRQWDDDGKVVPVHWKTIVPLLSAADAVVVSEEDLSKSEEACSQMAKHCNTLAVTLGPIGARVYHRGEERLVSVTPREEVDATGAGDIFAAAFFIHMQATQDPWTSAAYANKIASGSVGVRGLSDYRDLNLK
jgi:sugar/nucleoside kinase (ribokinase family)